MILRTIFLTLISITFSYSSFQEVTIGTIDKYYEKVITEEKLEEIIIEIKKDFQSQLNMNIFDYSSTGKKIDLIYLPPTKLDEMISRKLEQLEEKQKNFSEINKEFLTKKSLLEKKKEELKLQNKAVNEKIGILNDYIKEANNKKSVSKEEYKRIENYVNTERSKIEIEKNSRDKFKNVVNSEINTFNKDVMHHNNLAMQINILSKEIESLSRNNKVVKGKTFGTKEVELKTTQIDGKVYKEKNETNSMNRIEIYGFDNLNQLKAILAHEIAHLAGIPHIPFSGALMNPIIQKNQEEKLDLTKEDIKNFKDNF